MNTRATRTRLSVLPVFIALLVNLMAPVLSVALPDAAPEVFRPQSAAASDDPANGTQFGLQGCRLEAGDFIEASTTCEDAAYTPGNLGKQWAELDLVPYRLTVGSPVDQTFTIALAADYKYFDDGSEYLGYDVIGGIVLNEALSEGDCAIAPSGPNQFSGDDAAGGIDETIYQFVTVSAGEDATCVFDFYMRLALGSHSFSGASLHAYTLEHDLDPLGERRVSIFVKEIAPQELSKVMSATRGAAFAWSIQKSSDPTSLTILDTCVPDAESRQANVSVTVSWERTGPTAAGDVTVTTTITATNPAERSIIVNVEDKIYEGTTQDSQFGDTFTASATVPANSMQSWTHTVTGPSSATEFNDVAIATYTDLLTGVAVPGNTQATADATVELSTDDAQHESVTITDTESMTGSGLTFSVDSSTGASGTFTTAGGAAYTLGTATTGPVNWTSGTQTDSGSVTFNKTVYAAQGTTTGSGSLDDTATVLSGAEAIATASLSVGVTTDASVSLTINKSIPSGSLRSGESVTFDFEIYAGTEATGTPMATDSITINHGDLAGSTTVTGLDPGTYTVHEVPQPNWAEHVDQTTTIELPECEGSVSFNNSTLAPDLGITKEADADPVTSGDEIGFSILVSNDDEAGTGVAKDVTLNDPLPGSMALGVDWTLDAVLLNGVAVGDPATYCEITGTAPAQTLACEFGDMDPGDTAEVQVSSGTSALDGCVTLTLRNTATAESSNHETITASDSITVECPVLSIEKMADAGTVSAGDDIGFTITVANSDADGVGTATNVTLNDPLPGSLALDVDWSIDGVWLNGAEVEDPSLYCWITGDAPAQTLECEFGDMEPGDSAAVHVTSETSAPDGCLNADLENTATADADNHAEITADAAITIECPVLSLEKLADDGLVSVGEGIGFTMTVSNGGGADVGTATNVTIDDPLPGSLALGVGWSVDAVWLNGVEVGDPSAYCWITGDAPAQTLECEFGDMEPGDSAAVHVTSGTSDEGDCATANLQNEATADADNHAEITASDSIVVECPGLNILKTADADPIDAGEEASFTITVWNAGPGDAFDVTLHDTLPAGLAWDFEVLQGDADCGMASSVIDGGVEQRSIDCDLGDLAPSEMEDGVIIRVFADTDRDDCGLLENTAVADASNNDEVSSTDTLLVKCPTIALEKENDAVGSVLPGTTVTYTLTLTVDDGPAQDVKVVDSLPVGLENPTDISDGGVFDALEHTITWDLGDLADGEYTLTYDATVADDVENGEELVNAAAATSTNSQCPDLETLGAECEDGSTVIVRMPSLVIDKVADAEVITITGEAGDLSATPAVVTWTLSYTLTDGPVTDAVITDAVPAGLDYVAGSASDGGSYDAATDTLTWTFPTLSESGSVTFQTAVDPETISRVAPTVNVAVIRSNETPEDEGEDAVRVTVEAPPLGGNPRAPRPPAPPKLPDTAMATGMDGQPVTVPVLLLASFFLASLGAVALRTARERARRR